ncbi:Uncharacterized protein APZ42_004761 [Daphnia magna]|uniref:Uncharacterized protein n=1 Tax=Daphnia magna TaxID=35525 RepID=A0A164GV14_9CRUS|nr:Uncharacterized protein APZ42_004761 [Daphnia magna]
MKLLCAREKDRREVAEKQRQMDTEIYAMKELQTLSLKLNSPAKKNTCEYF